VNDDLQKARNAGAENVERSTTAAAVLVANIPVREAFAEQVYTLHVHMVRDLCLIYETDFVLDLAKDLVRVLVRIVPELDVTPMTRTSVPVLHADPPSDPADQKILATAATHALAAVFVAHFEQGGSLLDFDPVAEQDAFRTALAAGRKLAAPTDQDGSDAG